MVRSTDDGPINLDRGLRRPRPSQFAPDACDGFDSRAITPRVEGLLDGPSQGPLVPGGGDLSNSPSPHALAQGTDIGHDHRAGVRQRLVEHAALRTKRRVGQDHQAAASEEVHYLLLVDEPVDQLDAPRGQAAGKVPDLLEVTGLLRLPGDRQVALGEQLQGPQQDVQTLIWSDHSEEQQPLARPINRPHRPNRRSGRSPYAVRSHVDGRVDSLQEVRQGLAKSLGMHQQRVATAKRRLPEVNFNKSINIIKITMVDYVMNGHDDCQA